MINLKTYNITPREFEIIKLVSKGYSNKKISELLSISISTTKAHISSILYKLSLQNRIEIILFSIKNDLNL